MHKARILVIDDELAIRDSLRMTLLYEGYECVGAATGQEGLALAERERAKIFALGEQQIEREEDEIVGFAIRDGRLQRGELGRAIAAK